MIQLVESLEIEAPIERCFDLTRSVDFHVASSRPINARAIAGRMSGLSDLGDETTWSARYYGIRFRITTRITALDRPHSFREVLVSGLPRRFEHAYTFELLGPNRTRMIDHFTFQSPLGLLGGIVDRWLLCPRLSAVLKHRCDQIKQAAESGE